MNVASDKERILRPGRNCWRVEPADRVSFLIDGASFFRTFRSAVVKARRSVYVLAWDIDSRLRLLRDTPPDRAPVRLSEFLKWVIRHRRRLHVYLLSWDFGVLWSAHREWLAVYKLGGRTHRRMHVHLDDRHPVGACHHQKVVVVDGQIGFVGGLDLTLGRWDTPQHLPNDPRRGTNGSRQTRPYHDVQLLVSGDVATALGELFAQRWHRATGRAPHDAKATSRDSVAWPDGAHVDMEHVDVAIARTQPACNGQPEVREVEQLYLDAIAAARHSIYIENQYLTAKRVGAALAARLAEDDGPEVVLVSGGSAEGWLEQNTMDILRLRFITRLREADRHGQLRVYYPHLPGADGCDLNLHAKVMVVDQCFVRVGSANLNNRSMGFDTECDLAIEAAGEPRIEAAIARFRDRLLAEHLGVAVETVARARTAHGSLIAVIEALSSSGRGLRPLEPRLPTGTALSAEEVWLADPERPMDPDSLIGQFVPGVQYGAGTAARRVFWWLLALAAGFLLALAWRWTPLYEWLDPSPLIVLAGRLQQSAAAPVLTLAAFVAAVLLAVPLTLMVVVTVLVFGPWLGYAYSLPGALAGATAAYAVGRLLGRSSLRQLAGSRFGRLVQGLDRRGALTLAMVRVIPVAPFTLLNLAAGAARIRLRDFLLGTLLGLAPGMFAVVLLINLARNGVLSPGAGTLLVLAMVAALVGLAAYQLGKWLMRRAQPAAGGTV